jgi:hypothetical protein
MEPSIRDAIIRVLRESSRPLHYTEIWERLSSKAYYTVTGQTPAMTVNSRISASIKHEGKSSPFVRVEPATFTLRARMQKESSPTTPRSSRRRMPEATTN